MSRERDDGGAHVKQQLLAAVGADDSKPDDDVANVQEPEQKKPRTATAAKSKVARKFENRLASSLLVPRLRRSPRRRSERIRCSRILTRIARFALARS